MDIEKRYKLQKKQLERLKKQYDVLEEDCQQKTMALELQNEREKDIENLFSELKNLENEFIKLISELKNKKAEYEILIAQLRLIRKNMGYNSKGG